MKYYKRYIVMIAIWLALMPVSALASDISDAEYYGVVQVSNNSTAATNVSTIMTLSTAEMINAGYFNSSANNCAIRNATGADVRFMPSINSTYPWCLFVPSIGANSYLNDIMYDHSTGGAIRYFPDTGGMTISDHATLELGADGLIAVAGRIDATVADHIVYKPQAYYLDHDGSDNATFAITGEDNFLYPDSNTPNGWGNPTNAYDGNTGTYASIAISPSSDSAYIELLLDEAIILSGIKIYPDRATADVTNWDLDYYDGSWHVIFDDNSTFASWVTQAAAADNVTRLRFRAHAGVGGGTARLNEIYFNDDEGVAASVSVGGISSAEYDSIEGIIDAPIIGLAIDTNSNTAVPDIPTDNVQLGMPLWLPNKTGDSIISEDQNAFTCTNNGTAYTSQGRIFEDGDDINCGNDSVLNYTSGNFTIFAVVKFAVNGEAMDIVGRGTYGSNGYSLRKLGNERVAFYSWGPTKSSYTAINAVTSGVWYSIAVTISAAGVCNIYIDGIDTALEASADHSSIGSSTDNLYLGKVNNRTIDQFSGTYGEAWVIGEALSEAEILALHNSILWKYSGAYTDDNLIYAFTTATVPDNANDIVIAPNYVMPFIGGDDGYSFRLYQGGVLKCDIPNWEYDTTFHDDSGNGNDATPTFRTASSDADVSASLISWIPVTEAQAPAYTLGTEVDFISDNITMTSSFDVSPGPTSTIPFVAIIDAVSSASDTPVQLLYLIPWLVATLALSLGASYILRQNASGSLVVKMVVIVAMMGLAEAIDFGIDFWMIIVFIILAIAIMMASREQSWS